MRNRERKVSAVHAKEAPKRSGETRCVGRVELLKMDRVERDRRKFAVYSKVECVGKGRGIRVGQKSAHAHYGVREPGIKSGASYKLYDPGRSVYRGGNITSGGKQGESHHLRLGRGKQRKKKKLLRGGVGGGGGASLD